MEHGVNADRRVPGRMSTVGAGGSNLPRSGFPPIQEAIAMTAEIEKKIFELRSVGDSYAEIARKLQINEAELLAWTRWRQEQVRQKEGCCG
jgi:hypothetical protein